MIGRYHAQCIGPLDGYVYIPAMNHMVAPFFFATCTFESFSTTTYWRYMFFIAWPLASTIAQIFMIRHVWIVQRAFVSMISILAPSPTTCGIGAEISFSGWSLWADRGVAHRHMQWRQQCCWDIVITLAYQLARNCSSSGTRLRATCVESNDSVMETTCGIFCDPKQLLHKISKLPRLALVLGIALVAEIDCGQLLLNLMLVHAHVMHAQGAVTVLFSWQRILFCIRHVAVWHDVIGQLHTIGVI